VTGFVDRLAGMALGTPQPGAARVALPPRFLPPSAAGPLDQVDALPGDDPMPLPRSLPPAATQVSPRLFTAQVSPPRSAPATATHDGGITTGTVDVALPQARIATPAPLPHSTAPAPAAETGSVESAPMMPPALPLTRTAIDTRAAPRSDAPPTPLEPTYARARVHPVASILPAADRRVPSAPLSRVSVASRIAQPRDERPAVHVTIDRIDVRAPAAAKSEPTARRARPQPAVSLTEYLRGERGGRG